MSRIFATPLQFETFVFRAMSSCFTKQIGVDGAVKETKGIQFSLGFFGM